MQSTKLRAWAIGAMYAALTAGIGAVLSYTEELVRGDAQLLARWGMVILLVIATVRSYIDRTLAQVLPGAPKPLELDPHDATLRMPGVAETMRAALGDVPVVKSPPLPAGPTQLAHLEQVAEGIEQVRNFGSAGIPMPAVAANPRSQRDTDGRYLVDDAAAVARDYAEQARSAEEAKRKAAEQAELDRIAREQAEQEQRRQAEIADLEAKLAALRGGQ